MTNKTFEILDALNREGFDNSQLGFGRNIDSTAAYLGSDEDICIDYMFAYVYIKRDEAQHRMNHHIPDLILHWSNKHPVIPCQEELIYIYYLD